MRKRKLSAIVLAFVMVLALSACGKEAAPEVVEKSLYEQGLDVISLMVEATRSENYLEVYTGSNELVEIILNIGEGDFAAPKAVYSVTVSDMVLWEFGDYINLNGLSDELKGVLNDKMLGALATRINALSGANTLAATSVCAMGKTFLKSDMAEDVVYIYTYENAVPVAVTFIVGEGGAVSATGNFIVHDEFTYGSAEEITEFFGYVEVSEVTME